MSIDKMNPITTTRFVRGRRGAWPLIGALSLGLVLAGCDADTILDVETPDIVPGEVAANPDNLPSLRNGVLFEFARAYTGQSGPNDFPGIIGTSGVFTDEQWYSSTFDEMKQIDRRSIVVENDAIEETFHFIQRARNWAEVATGLYADSELANTADHALMGSLAGYSQLFLAENFCSGVPVSSTSIIGELEYGPGLTTDELLERALGQFEAAESVAQAAGDAEQENLARIGQARTLLDLGRIDEAAAEAAQVTSDFAYLVHYSESASGQNNGIWTQINSNRRSSLASDEGSDHLGLRFFNPDGENATDITTDPRVPVVARDQGLGTLFPVFMTGKLATRGSDVPLGSYIEAQLIVAEGLLDSGNSTAYLPVLNDLRANLQTYLPMLGITPDAGASLAPLTDPGSAHERVRQLFQERAFWLHLTAHRLSDVRRMIRQYGFTPDEVLPTGETIFGQPYGPDLNFPIPFVEGNNPEFSGQCIDRAA